MKALLIGSAFMEELYDYLDFFDTRVLIKGESPLADDFPLLLDHVEEGVDCALVDLMVCASWLYRQSGKLKTLHDRDNPKEVYDPSVFKCTQFDKNFSAFMAALADRFPADRVFLIAASLPPYYAAQSQLRNINKAEHIAEWKQSYKYIRKLEDRFIKKTGASVIQLAQYYFVKKHKGYEVSFVRYEETLYRDINQWFYEREQGMVREQPLFRFKLDRYVRYQYKTVHYKGFYRFLKEENMVDRLILSSPGEFVMDYYNDFLRLNTLEEQLHDESLYEAVQRDAGLSEEFRKVVLGFLLLQDSEAAGQSPDMFRQMFKNTIVPDGVKKKLRDYWSKRGVNPKKITNHNAGYYYAKMAWGAGEKEAKQFVSDHAVIEPVLVDVYGSCIACQPINEHISGATGVVHNHYYIHVPVYEGSEMPVEHPEVVWQGEPADEFEKNVRLQFEHRIEDDLKSSEAEWCLVDLFSLAAPRTFLYGDFCFTDFGNKTWQGLGAQNIHPWNGYYQELLQKPEFLERIHKWAGWIREKYGDKVILVDFKVSQYKIGDDGRLYNAYKNAGRKNEIIDKVYSLVKEWLDCYCIEFGREFLADDIGYASSSSVHYELDFYEAEADVIQKIIADRPAQKIYATYSNEMRVERILRLAGKNPPELLRQVFTGKLDGLIVALPAETIAIYKREIAAFYDQGIDSREALLKAVSRLEEREPSRYYKLKRAVFEAEAPGGTPSVKMGTGYGWLPEMAFYIKYKGRMAKNTSYTIEFYDGDEYLFAQKVIYGVKSQLQPAPERQGAFSGWKAYRTSDGTVCCVQEDGKRVFISEEESDEDHTLYLFPDRASVAKNSKIDGDVIKMYGVWEGQDA